jgi:hypothetical protein
MPQFGPSISLYLKEIARDIHEQMARDDVGAVDRVSFDVAPVANPEPPKEPPMATPAPLPVTSKLPDTIQTAAQKKIDAEMGPVIEKIASLRGSLLDYEFIARQETERRVVNAVLVALGQEQQPEMTGAEASREALRAALLEVWGLVGGPPFVSPPSAAEVPVAVMTPTPAAPPTPKPTKPPCNPAIYEKAKQLINEIEMLSPTVKDNHPVRLFPLLQAMVAEARLYMDALPDGHQLNERLSRLMPVLGAMKVEGGVQEYIRGLAFGSQGDWNRLSYANRLTVTQFDRDATPPEPPKSTPKTVTKKAESEKASVLHTWPKLPWLRDAMKKKPLIIVGGLIVNEKLDLCTTRFGIKLEWHEAEGDSVRSAETMAQRIRAGGPAGVLVLEGLLGHKSSDKIISACKAKGIPFAYVDKGGVASIEAGLNTIETKLASVKF